MFACRCQSVFRQTCFSASLCYLKVHQMLLLLNFRHEFNHTQMDTHTHTCATLSGNHCCCISVANQMFESCSLPACLPACLSACLPASPPSVHPSVCLSVCGESQPSPLCCGQLLTHMVLRLWPPAPAEHDRCLYERERVLMLNRRRRRYLNTSFFCSGCRAISKIHPIVSLQL